MVDKSVLKSGSDSIDVGRTRIRNAIEEKLRQPVGDLIEHINLKFEGFRNAGWGSELIEPNQSVKATIAPVNHNPTTRLDVDKATVKNVEMAIGKYLKTVDYVVGSIWMYSKDRAFDAQMCDGIVVAIENEASLHTERLVLIVGQALTGVLTKSHYGTFVLDVSSTRDTISQITEEAQASLEKIAREKAGIKDGIVLDPFPHLRGD